MDFVLLVKPVRNKKHHAPFTIYIKKNSYVDFISIKGYRSSKNSALLTLLSPVKN